MAGAAHVVRRWLVAVVVAATAGAGLLVPAAPVGAADAEVVLPPEARADCARDVPIVVASDAAAQSDIYSSVTLAGVIGSDCIVLAGARGARMTAVQRGRLRAAAAGGFVVGGFGAVPDAKLAGRDMTRLAGIDRWHTARLVGAEALVLAGGAGGDVTASVGAEDPDTDCTGDVPIVVASDVAAQSDIYSSVTLAAVVGTDCIVLAGARGGRMTATQRVRLRAAAAGGFVVGGFGAVPDAKLAGRDMTRLAGIDRWHTARLVGDEARRLAVTSDEDVEPDSDSDAEPGSEPDLSEIVEAEQVMADLVNELRRGLGLDPLTYNDDLAEVARTWSETMRDDDIFTVDPTYSERYPAGWQSAAESVAMRSSNAQLLGTVQLVYFDLIANPKQLANMTSTDFNEVGVGIAVEGRTVWVTQNFAHYPGANAGPNLAELRIAEQVMADLVNELRRGLGLDPLTYNDDVAEVARSWSETMRDDDIFFHNPSYSDQYPSGWRAAGENIAWRQSGGSLLDYVHAAFNSLVDSPGHYANMISASFNQIGVGVAVKGRGFWVTQNFANYPS